MEIETITERVDLVIRRMTLGPGEEMYWHTDSCRRFSVVVSGSKLAIEYRDDGELHEIEVTPGMADWDVPDDRVHRAINQSDTDYVEIVTFYRTDASVEPQPVHD